MRACHVVTGGRADFSERGFWDVLVQRDPRHALGEIDRILDHEQLDDLARCLATSARGRCLFDLGRVTEAVDEATRAAAAAEALEPTMRASVVMSAAAIMAEAGDVSGALTALASIAAHATDIELARVRIQTAYVQHSAGHLHEALRELDAAEQLMAADAVEARDLVRLHQNRGLVLLQQGSLDGAESDFVAAGAAAEHAGMAAAHAQAVANLAVVHGRARRLQAAVRHFERAADLFRAAGSPARTMAATEIDRAELMMHSGLPGDAVDAALAALRLVETSGNRVMVGDATLLLAQAELSAGRHRDAVATARGAAEVFEDAHRPDMRMLAAAVAMTARLRGAPADDVVESLVGARQLGAALSDIGWSARADEIALECVRAARRVGEVDAVGDELDRLRAVRDDGHRNTELPGWYADAVARAHLGDLEGALDSCRFGLDVLDRIADEAETLERRSHVMRLGHDLSQLTIELAVELDDAGTVIAAAEGTRARALHDELFPGRRHRPLTERGARHLHAELAGRLDRGTLIEWVVVRNDVFAVVVDDRGSQLFHIGPRAAVVQARDRLLAWLDRAAAEPNGSSAGAARAARLLDDVLFGPLDLPPDRDLILAPVDELHGVPWSGLPSLSARAVALTPSAQVWLETDRRASEPVGSAALLVGPHIEGSEREEAALRTLVPGAVIAASGGATVASLRSLLATSDLVQLSVHGAFRSDRPMLSTLELAEGPVPLEDALPDRVTSRLVVLSSCEGGAQGTADGSEVLGIAAVLLARGAAAVLAPLSVVRELECADFVVEVHGELAIGRSVGAATAQVRSRWLRDDDLSRWAVASSFACFGSGSVAVSALG